MRYQFALLLAIAILGLSGCSKGSDTVTSAPRSEAALPSGWKEISTSGVALSFPPDWKAMDLSQDAMAKGGDAMMGNDPKFAQMRQQADQMAKSGMFKVFVFDTKALNSGFATNCNVSLAPLPAGTTLDASVDATKTQIEPMIVPGTKMEVDYVNLKAGRAARIRTHLKTASATVATVSSLSYMMLKDGQLLGVTFSSRDEDADAVAKVAEQVMASFRFTK